MPAASPTPADAAGRSARLRELLLASTGADERALLEPPLPEVLQAQLPGYSIEKMLGRGGMGAVYLGRQTVLGRTVAVKVMPPLLEMDDDSFVDRFKNEARAMARLDHPCIVAVYESGQTQDGMLYFAMEHVDGTDIQRLLTRHGKLKPTDALAITAHVCDALSYAHSQGLIHRDIKPSNILISDDGQVKVADFGLAKALNTDATALTQTGAVMGTLHYMAPEAFVLGSGVDYRADIYALGVMLYQMLTGRLPQGVFELPSAQVPGLDPRFDDIIARAMREDRTLRYQSVLDMRRDLDAMLTQPVPEQNKTPARPAAVPPMADTRVHRHAPPRVGRWLWLAAAAVLVLGIGGLCWSQHGQNVPENKPQASPAVVPLPPAAPPPAPAAPPKAAVTTPQAKPAIPPATTKPTAKAPNTTIPKAVAAKASVPAPPAPSSPPAPPVAAPVPLDFREYLGVIAGVSADWHEHVVAPHEKSLAELRGGYLRALQRESKSLSDAFANEARLLQNNTLPATDDPALPPRLLELRRIFRAESAKGEQSRAATAAGLKVDLIEKLATLQKSLQTASKDPQAAAVAVLIHELQNGQKELEQVLNADPASSTVMTAVAAPDGKISTGGTLVDQENFDPHRLMPGWVQKRDAWQAPLGRLGTSPLSLQRADDKDWGCWLARDLPERMRMEFDVTFFEDSAVMLCELYTSSAWENESPAGKGYRLVFGGRNNDRPTIFRGLSPLTSSKTMTIATAPPDRLLHHAYRMVIQRVDGRTLEWFIDGKLHASCRDNVPLRKGWAGFQFEEGITYYDNLRIFDLADDLDPTTIPARARVKANGRPSRGGAVLIQNPSLKDWLCVTKPGPTAISSWLETNGRLTTSAQQLRAAGDSGRGCWLMQELPQSMRLEFDLELKSASSVMVCEFYAPKPDLSTQQAARGWTVGFGMRPGTGGRFTRAGQTARDTDLPAKEVVGKIGDPYRIRVSSSSHITGNKTVIHRVILQRVDGRTMECFIDGHLHARGIDLQPSRTGYLGFHFRGDSVEYHNLKLYDLNREPSSISTASSTSASADSFEAATSHALMKDWIERYMDPGERFRAKLVHVAAAQGLAVKDARFLDSLSIFSGLLVLNSRGYGYHHSFLRDRVNVWHPHGKSTVIPVPQVKKGAPVNGLELQLEALAPQEYGSLTGKVTLPDGLPAVKAIVRLGGIVSTVTDAQGVYVFSRLPRREYLVSAECPQGFISQNSNLGDDTQLDLQIKEAPMYGLRWKVQNMPTNPSLSGPDLVQGEGFFSMGKEGYRWRPDTLMGLDADFTLQEEARHYRIFARWDTRWRRESRDYAVIDEVATSGFFTPLVKETEVRVGDVFTLKGAAVPRYGIVQITWLPVK